MLPLIALLLATQEASTEADQAVRKLRPASGLRVELFSAEPQAVNIVSLAVDDRGRVFVTETHRRHSSVLEVWDRTAWHDDDLASRSVEDRAALYRKRLGAAADTLAVESERIRLLEDRDGDGRADVATTFAEGFHGLVDGLGSGVLARGDEVWFTCVPTLWKFRGTERRALHTGFGVHMGSGAHDLHGLCFGPDGKLYFSMGDRGLQVGAISLPDTGAVLRCNPDGTDLEVFATGLRNPQQLAFDALGNLWTGDNNSDAGDKARWCWVLEGGDSGWRFGYQHNILKSPWMVERLWDLDAGKTAPSLVPPVGHVGHGPAGIAYYAGTGLPAAYDDHFFMADFPGSVRSFAVRARGAGYELVDDREFLGELWPTDVEVGPDGAVYVSDWVQGWAKPGKGRIFRVVDPSLLRTPEVLETKTLLAEGMDRRSVDEVAKLLGHRNQRVRQAAQFALAARGAEAALTAAATTGRGERLSRIHAVWALGQIRKTEPLLPLLADPDPELRAQAAGVLGERREPRAFDGLVAALRDEAPRVRLFAATALGKLGRKEAVAPLFAMLRSNDDPFLRNAGVIALARIGDVDAVLRERSLEALLVLRRLGRPEVASYLDAPETALEAARAIHDVPIPAALSALAARLGTSMSEMILSRSLNANFRLGNAKAVAEFAGRKDAPESLRAEALRMLADWERPSGRDRVMGLWRPIAPRDPAPALEALAALNLPDSLRIEFLRAQVALRDPRAGAALADALEDRDELFRREAVRLLVGTAVPNKAVLLTKLSTEANPLAVRQEAIASMGDVDGADGTLTALLDVLLQGALPRALHYDLLEAAGRRTSAPIRERLAAFEVARKKDDPLGAVRELLEGGDTKAGRAVFFERMDAACLRCHQVKDKGGLVGPPLTKVGAERTREQILESILFPNKEIVKGYGQEAFALESGDVASGRVESEGERELVLILSDGRKQTIQKSGIRARKAALSAMPEDAAKTLSKRDLRDLVAFLAELKR